jgi:hypothetical protein
LNCFFCKARVGLRGKFNLALQSLICRTGVGFKPSERAMTAAALESSRPLDSSRPIRLMILTKSHTLSGEAKRAVPPVGMTWLGPAT